MSYRVFSPKYLIKILYTYAINKHDFDMTELNFSQFRVYGFLICIKNPA